MYRYTLTDHLLPDGFVAVVLRLFRDARLASTVTVATVERREAARARIRWRAEMRKMGVREVRTLLKAA